MKYKPYVPEDEPSDTLGLQRSEIQTLWLPKISIRILGFLCISVYFGLQPHHHHKGLLPTGRFLNEKLSLGGLWDTPPLGAWGVGLPGAFGCLGRLSFWVFSLVFGRCFYRSN